MFCSSVSYIAYSVSIQVTAYLDKKRTAAFSRRFIEGDDILEQLRISVSIQGVRESLINSQSTVVHNREVWYNSANETLGGKPNEADDI